MKSGKLKKSIVPMLVLAVLISTGSGLIGCSVKENSAADEKKDIKIESSVSASSPAPTEAEEKTEPVTAIDAEKLDGMLPVFDSLIRYHEESDKDLKYDSQNAGYVWGALYYLMVNYAVAGENGVTQTEDYEKISVPAETVLRCAQGMFADMKELPPIPEDKGGIQYQEEEDRYLFEMSDKSEAVTKIESYVRDSDGTYLVHVSYTQTAPYTFRIVNNVLAEEDKTPVFYYAVQEIVSK